MTKKTRSVSVRLPVEQVSALMLLATVQGLAMRTLARDLLTRAVQLEISARFPEASTAQ